MNFQTCLMHAIDTVLASDLPDDNFAAAVNDQAKLMAGIAPEDDPTDGFDYH